MDGEALTVVVRLVARLCRRCRCTVGQEGAEVGQASQMPMLGRAVHAEFCQSWKMPMLGRAARSVVL